MRNWLCCLGVALTVSLIMTRRAHAAEWKITQVTDYDASDGLHSSVFDVAVSDTRVAWSSTPDDDLAALMVYDGSETRIVAEGGNPPVRPVASGSSVIWMQWGATRSSLKLHDGDGSRTIPDSSHVGGSWDISGSYIVWTDSETAPFPWGNLVHFYDRTGAGRTVFGDGGEDLESPVYQHESRVSGSHIIWQESDGIYLYDIPSESFELLPDTAGAEHLELSDSHLVWRQGGSDESPEGYEIFLQDIASGNRVQLTDNDLEDARPHVSEGKVVWRGYDGHDWEVFLYDGQNTLPLTDNDFSDAAWDVGEGPLISGSTVAWRGHDGNDWEVFVSDEDGVVQLTENEYDDRSLALYDSRVAWAAWDSPDSQVLLAVRVVPEPSAWAILISGGILLLRRNYRASG